MSKPEDDGIRLNCFSPPVMLLTMAIEFGLIIYALWRYKMSPVTRLICLFLLALATFQVAEYFVCTGQEVYGALWSQIGFVAISTLPPLGLHLAHVLAKKPPGYQVFGAYGIMLIFISFFLFSPDAFTSHQCTGNYVIMQFEETWSVAYFAYYLGLMLAAIFLSNKWSNELKAKGKLAKKRIQAMRALIVGYLAFTIPTGLAYAVRPETRDAIPSIACGFAVLFALILGFYILPRLGVRKQRK